MHRYLFLLLLFLCANHSALADPEFTDVAAAVGIHFQHRNGAQGDKHLPETMGAGVAYFDYDNDGRQDLYFVNTAGPATLYRNRQDGQFVDVTQAAGVGNSGYGMGVAAADYDNDGHVDLYITTYGPNLLYHNKGNGRFADVTTAAGVGHPDLAPEPPLAISTTTAMSTSTSPTTSIAAPTTPATAVRTSAFTARRGATPPNPTRSTATRETATLSNSAPALV